MPTVCGRAAGTGIALWPNGIKALRAIGPDVEEEVASRGCDISGMILGMVDEPGQAPPPPEGLDSLKASLGKAAMGVAQKAFPKIMRWQNNGDGLNCIRWASVQAALASFLPPECIHLDSALDTMEVLELGSGREAVRVAFKARDGTPAGGGGGPVVADMLIGADGINSAVRAALVGDGPPRDNGRVIWRGVINTPAAINFPSTDAYASASAATQSGFPEFCPAGSTVIKASKDSTVGRTVCFMDVGGGGIYWAAGCLDAGIAASARAGADANDNAAAAVFVDKAAEARASCALTFADYPDVLACLEVTPGGYRLPRHVVQLI